MNKTAFTLILAALVSLASCDINDPIYTTAHPEQGRIIFAMDFSQRTDGAAVPAEVTARVGQHSATLATGRAIAFPHLIDPGACHITIYNAADKITVSGTTASVAVTSGIADPLPGWLFSWVADRQIEKDRDYNLPAAMRQQVRQLTLVIEPTGGTANRIESITGTLSGVAGSLDIGSGTHSTPVSVKPVFAKQADGKWTATVRLLGVAGAQQKLIGTMTFTGGTPGDLPLESDLSAKLSGFNADKKTPLTLEAQEVEMPIEAGFAATINGWDEIQGGSVIVD